MQVIGIGAGHRITQQADNPDRGIKGVQPVGAARIVEIRRGGLEPDRFVCAVDEMAAIPLIPTIEIGAEEIQFLWVRHGGVRMGAKGGMCFRIFTPGSLALEM